MNQKVCLITGVSQGMGLEFTKLFLNNGYTVIGTSRNINNINSEILNDKNFKPVPLDLVDDTQVKDRLTEVISNIGYVDVLINNAGYSLFGALEEASYNEIVANYNVNVFGLISVTRAVLPFMRSNKSGHIINISSIGGYVGEFPGAGTYCSTKFAVAGLSEGLKAEVEPLGIDVTIVYPGYFKTNFLEDSSMKITSDKITDYEAAHKVTSMHQNEINRNQNGDPIKLAKLIFDITEMKERPFHLFVGTDAIEYAEKKIEQVSKEIENFKMLSLSTDY